MHRSSVVAVLRSRAFIFGHCWPSAGLVFEAVSVSAAGGCQRTILPLQQQWLFCQQRFFNSFCLVVVPLAQPPNICGVRFVVAVMVMGLRFWVSAHLAGLPFGQSPLNPRVDISSGDCFLLLLWCQFRPRQIFLLPSERCLIFASLAVTVVRQPGFLFASAAKRLVGGVVRPSRFKLPLLL
jgi:hypothetical protein